MGMLIEKKNTLKAFYYLMAIDGIISDDELEQFGQIGNELLGEAFAEISDDLISECNAKLYSIAADENRYDIISEMTDAALSVKASTEEEGVLPRFLVWNILAIAHSDNNFSADEKRLIDHIARTLGIDKSVYAEMNQYIDTAMSVQKELDILSQSERPYSEVRPVVEEAEKRRASILKAALQLIEDEMLMTKDTAEKSEASDKKADVNNLAEVFAPAAQNVSKAAAEGARNIKDGADKLFSKVTGTMWEELKKIKK